MNNATSGLSTRITQLDSAIDSRVTNANKNISTRITQLEGSIDSKVANGLQGVNSQITQVANSIDLKVANATKALTGQEIVSRINLSPDGTRIDGKLLHVTGKAKFDDDIITSKMLQASAVTADKIKVDSLSSITANVGTLTGGTIVGTTIRNGSGTFSVSADGSIKGATIDAQSFRKSGFEITAMRIEHYLVADGAQVPVPDGFNRDDANYIVLEAKNFKRVFKTYGANRAEGAIVVDFEKGFITSTKMKAVSLTYGYRHYKYQYEEGFIEERSGINLDYVAVARRKISPTYVVDGAYAAEVGYINILCIATKK